MTSSSRRAGGGRRREEEEGVIALHIKSPLWPWQQLRRRGEGVQRLPGVFLSPKGPLARMQES